MRKLFVSLVLLLSMLLSFSVIAAADENRIVDERRNAAFSAEEEQAIYSALATAEEKTGYNYYIYITESVEIGEDSEYFVSSVFDLSNNDDAIVLHIIKNNYLGVEYGIYTSGDAEELSDATINRILDTEKVYDDLKAGRLYDGIIAFAKAVPEQKARFEKNSLIAVITVSVILALIVGGAVVGAIIYKYKKKLKSPSYPLSKFANMSLEHSADSFLGSAVTKTRVSSSSSSRSGTGGGGGASFRGKR